MTVCCQRSLKNSNKLRSIWLRFYGGGVAVLAVMGPKEIGSGGGCFQACRGLFLVVLLAFHLLNGM